MPRSVPVQTPLGTFATAGEAAAAHACTTANILYRVRTFPDQYRKLGGLAEPARPKLMKPADQITIADWPLAWSQYCWLTAEQREQIYTQWLGGRDPESEAMVQEFFAEMDRVGAVEQAEDLVEEEPELETDSEQMD